MIPRRPPVHPAPSWRFPQPTSSQLSCGATLDCYNLPGQRVIAATLVVDAPLTAEPGEVEGVAALAMQASDEGTLAHPGPAMTEALEECGAAVVSAGAGLNGATLTVEVPGSRLQDAMPLIAELVREPAYADADAARLVEDRLLAIATGECSPPVVATKAFYSALGRHRLARPLGGDATTVANITPATLHAWHDAAIRPERSRLILAGDLPEDAAAWADAAFHGWHVDTPALPDAVPPPAPPGRRVLLTARDAAQVSVRLGTLVPTRHHTDWPGLQVANAVIGSMFGSRLNTVLREERGLTYGAGSALGAHRDNAVFLAYAETDPNSACEAIQLALQLLDALASPITDAEARDAINYITGATPLRLDTAMAIAAQTAEFALGGVPADWFDDYMARLRSVTADDATAAFARHISPDNLVIAVCGDAAALAPQLEAIGLKPEITP